MPAMKEAAAAFGTAHGVTVDVTAGPSSTRWLRLRDTLKGAAQPS